MEAMEYKYDVFISYSRSSEWPEFVREFVPIFKHWLGEQDSRSPRVFVDYIEIETGVTWPLELKSAVAHSKVLVPLWSKSYFRSDWCISELGLILERERRCGFRTTLQPSGLIVPVVLCDGESFPETVKNIQCERIDKWAGVRIARRSRSLEKLEKRLRDWVPAVAKAIQRAPRFDPSWPDTVSKDILDSLRIDPPDQRDLPSLK